MGDTSEDLPTTIQIRNPHVIQIVREEMAHGIGRGFAETAENMILADAERRRLQRAKERQQSRRAKVATPA